MQIRESPSWDDLRYFLAVAREGPDARRRAPARCQPGAPQPTRRGPRTRGGRAALDRHHARLDPHWRRSRHCSPPPSASKRRCLRASRTSGAARRSRARCASGRPTDSEAPFSPRGLGRFRAAYPDLRVQLVPVPRSFSLSEREADIAIMVGRPERGRLSVRSSSTTPWGSTHRGTTSPGPAAPGTRRPACHTLIGYVDDLIYSAELNYAREIWRDWQSDIEVATADRAVRGGSGRRRHRHLSRLHGRRRRGVGSPAAGRRRRPGATGSSGMKTCVSREAFRRSPTSSKRLVREERALFALPA